ncbi:MAG: glycosyltransferase family 4 protein [Longimicrobiales bacterium]
MGNFPPPYGGVPAHLADLAPFLAERGWRVTVLSPVGGREDSGAEFQLVRDNRGKGRKTAAAAALLAESALRGEARRALQWRSTMPVRTWVRALATARLALERVDVGSIHLVAGYNLLFGAPAAAVLSDLIGVPLVVTNFGEIHSHHDLAREHVRFFSRLVERARLTAISHHCARSFEDLGISATVDVLPYGVDLEHFGQGDGEGFRSRHGIPPTAPVAAFVGRLVRDMGLDAMLAALPAIRVAVPDAVVLIAGADGKLRSAVEAAVREAPLNVRLFVNVPEVDLPGLIAAAQVVVVPSAGTRACGSLAAIEAMAAGRAVVATRIGGVPEIVTEECGVLLDTEGSSELAQAVISLLRSPARCSVMGTRGRQRAAQRFDRLRTNGAIEAFFRASLPGEAARDRTGS